MRINLLTLLLFLGITANYSCKNNTNMSDNNPLLQSFNTPHQTAPFDKIKEEHFLPAFQKAMEEGRADIEAIINNPEQPTFENTIEALEKSGEKLNRISNIFFNLNAAETNDKIQSIAREVSPMLSEYSNDIWLSDKLFEKVKAVYEKQHNADALNEEQHKLLEDTYKSFTRKGALLSGDKKEKYREISAELSKLALQFGENVLA